MIWEELGFTFLIDFDILGDLFSHMGHRKLIVLFYKISLLVKMTTKISFSLISRVRKWRPRRCTLRGSSDDLAKIRGGPTWW